MIKRVKSPGYNYVFDSEKGLFIRWGKTKDDDPLFSPVGPEILDLEMSTICPRACEHCYKSNTNEGKMMTFSTFKDIFQKFPKTLTQIAFGIGSFREAKSELLAMMEYCRANSYNKVVPNVTVNGEDLTTEDYQALAKLCGAVSVSFYDKDNCYRAINALTQNGLSQANIHIILSEETLPLCYEVMDDFHNDARLSMLNAIVLLLLKPKGKRNVLHPVQDMGKIKDLIDYAFEHDVPIGFDSCTAPMFLKSVEHREDFKDLSMTAEPCESFGLFSAYVNVDGDYFPCSFAEGEGDWKEGMSVVDCKDFLKDIWYSEKLDGWRKKSLALSSECDCTLSSLCRPCPIFDITPCQRENRRPKEMEA